MLRAFDYGWEQERKVALYDVADKGDPPKVLGSPGFIHVGIDTVRTRKIDIPVDCVQSSEEDGIIRSQI